MKFSIVLALGSLALVGCSNANTNPVRPESTTSVSSAGLTAPSSAKAEAIHPTPDAGVGFHGVVSGFPHGIVSVNGGGAFDLASGFAKLSGGFSCLRDVGQGPLSISINLNDPGPCLQGQGVRWDTAQLLPDTGVNGFKCTGADAKKQAATGENPDTHTKTVVLQADFYRAGDANDESFTAEMIVSDGDIAPNDFPGANLWVQGVGCGRASVNFSNKSK